MGADPGAPAGRSVTSATFSARLKEARANAGLSIKGLYLAADTSRRSVSTWESSEATPRIDTVQKLAEALGVTPCWLAYGCECGTASARGTTAGQTP